MTAPTLWALIFGSVLATFASCFGMLTILLLEKEPNTGNMGSYSSDQVPDRLKHIAPDFDARTSRSFSLRLNLLFSKLDGRFRLARVRLP